MKAHVLRLPRTKVIAAAVLIACLLTSAQAASETAEAKGSRDRDLPHYESPIVSLLLLPVTLLIRMTAAIAPDAGRSDERTERGRE